MVDDITFDIRADAVTVDSRNRLAIHEVKTSLVGGNPTFTDGQRLTLHALAEGNQLDVVVHGARKGMINLLDVLGHGGSARVSAGEIHTFG